jgi:hypothetical protein
MFGAESLAQSGCELLDKSKKAQVVSYDGYAEFAGIRLRLTNNTNCSVTVETDEKASRVRFIKRADGRVAVESSSDLESKDGAIVRLHYQVQNTKKWQAPVNAYGWGDSVLTYDVPGGQSIYFYVPSIKFKEHLDIVVPFKYAWESGDT